MIIDIFLQFYRHCLVYTDFKYSMYANMQTAISGTKFFLPVHDADREVGQIDNQSRLNLPVRYQSLAKRCAVDVLASPRQ